MMRLHLCAVFHVVDEEGNKLYDGQVIDRIEQVKYKESPLVKLRINGFPRKGRAMR